MLPILIFPTLSTNISDRIKNLKEIKSFECTFSDTTAANYQTRFDSIFNFGCYLKKVSIKTSFRDKKPKNIESILQDANLKYSKLKIYGKSDSGPDIIDVLKQTFTKKSKIETSSISVHNFDPIKKALNDFSDL